MPITDLKSDKPIWVKLQTAFGDGVLTARTIKATERLDEPFEIVCEAVSDQHDLDFRTILGTGATVTLDCNTDKRYFNGVVTSFQQLKAHPAGTTDLSKYQFTIHPKIWLLKLVRDCRVFQNQTPLQIIETILTEQGITDYRFSCVEAGQVQREYCVQFNETDFDFICRLMEEEGIFYYFEHQDSLHTFVLGDKVSTLQPCLGAEQLQMADVTSHTPWLNTVVTCEPKQRMVSQSYTLMDFNMTNAGTPLKSTVQGDQSDQSHKGEQYSYPGGMDQDEKTTQSLLEQITRLRLEAVEALNKHVVGTSTSPFLGPGYTMQLQGHPRSDVNQVYVMREIVHEIRTQEHDSATLQLYQNTFEGFEKSLAYRPQQDTPQPQMPSVQTATVTGPEGEEIWTDDYGRIKVQFHWDRQGNNDENSSCWLRVAQGWGGNDWGVLFTPRVGMEVLVTFLDGDPDRPLVTGCVYNSLHRPPYLPERVTNQMIPTMSGLKSQSSKGGNGFNEIRFNDLKDEEQLYIRAQKNLDQYILENETKYVESGSVWETIQKGDRDIALQGDPGALPKTVPTGQDHPVGAGDDNLELRVGNRHTSFLSENGPVQDTYRLKNGSRYGQIDQGDDEMIQQAGNRIRVVQSGNATTLLSSGDMETYLQSGDHKTLLQKGNKSLQIESGDHIETIQSGKKATSIQLGDRKIHINEGNYAIRIDLGNRCVTVEEGSYKTRIGQGEHVIEIGTGDCRLEIGAGDVSDMVDGAYTGEYSGDYELTVGGAIEITAGGDVTIAAGGAVEVSAGGDVSVEAGGAIEINAGGAIEITAGGDLTLTAGGAIEISAGGAMTQETGAELNISSGAAVTIEAAAEGALTTGAALEIQSGAELAVSTGGAMEISAGAMVTVEAGGVLNMTAAGEFSVEAPLVFLA